VLQDVVALVKASKGGLRAEQIRAKLGMQRKEMPRVLREGLAKILLRSKGQKRSTTYTAS
jgi:Fic family protein